MSIFEDMFGVTDARNRARAAEQAAREQAALVEANRLKREQAMREVANLSKMDGNNSTAASVLAGGTAISMDQAAAAPTGPLGKTMASLLGLRV